MRFTELPPAFREYMKALLGEEYEAYERCFDEKRLYGLRINTGKADAAGIKGRLPFPFRRFPGQTMDFTTKKRTVRQSIPFIMQAFIIFRSPAPWPRRRSCR